MNNPTMNKLAVNNITETNLSRREFIKGSAAAMGGLVIGFYLPLLGGRAYAAEAQPKPGQPTKQIWPPNAFIRIAPDDSITIVVNKSEMGQGVYTSLPMLIAEELEADWSRICIDSAPVAAVYNHTAFGMQMTGGSSSIPSSWEQLRRVGASARTLLVRAAAQQWGVPESECHAVNSQVIHAKSGNKASYGKLADAAAKLPLPDNVELKSPKDFKLIGKPTKRLDTPAKINGSALFGLDVYLPGMLTVVIARSPVFGGQVKRFDASEARKLAGVQGVYQVPTGIAVAATGFWPAKTARDLLEIEWDEGPGAALSTPAMRAEYLELAKKPGAVARKDGDTVQGFKKAHKSINAEYELPYLAHAAMEPLNVVVDLKPDHCTIWTGTQAQTMDRAMAAQTAMLNPEQVEINTTFLGGGFGRRANPRSDFVTEAVQVAMAVGKPVKVIWTREDDMRGGNYRPMWSDHIEAGIAKNGKPIAWKHTIVGQSIVADTSFEAFMTKNGIDATSVEGAATLPYVIPNLQVELHSPKNAVPVQWWRSVGHSHTAFVVETMIDELAHLAGKDPVAYRLSVLGYSREELLSMSVFDIDTGVNADSTKVIEAQLRQSGRARFETVHRRKDGSTFPVEVSATLIEIDKPYLLSIVRDITRRKENEDKIKRLNRIYSVLSGINTTIVRVREEDELLGEACRIAVEHGEFIFAWIGKFDAGSQQVTPVAQAGRDDGYLAQINLTARDDAPGSCALTAQALTEAKPMICNDIASDERMATLRSEALSRGYRSVVVLPLMLEGKPVGVFVLYAAESGVFDDEEMRLLVEMSADISFALGYFSREAQRKQAEDELRKLSLAVEQSPNSIVITGLDANLEYLNEAFVKTTGYSRAEAIGQNPRILHSGKNSREVYDDMWAHLTRGDVWKGELINRRKDGSEYVESILISPVCDNNGHVTHYLGIKEDITERKLAEAKLAEQIEELRRWHDATLGREMRTIELKREVNKLLGQAGKPPRYPSAEPDETIGQNG